MLTSNALHSRSALPSQRAALAAWGMATVPRMLSHLHCSFHSFVTRLLCCLQIMVVLGQVMLHFLPNWAPARHFVDQSYRCTPVF